MLCQQFITREVKNLSHPVIAAELPARAEREKFRLDQSSQLRMQVSVFVAEVETQIRNARTTNYDLRRTTNEILMMIMTRVTVTGRAA